MAVTMCAPLHRRWEWMTPRGEFSSKQSTWVIIWFNRFEIHRKDLVDGAGVRVENLYEGHPHTDTFLNAPLVR